MSDLENLKETLTGFYGILTNAGQKLNDTDQKGIHKNLCDLWRSSQIRKIEEVQAEYPFSFIVDE
jgi:hypothetical protein